MRAQPGGTAVKKLLPVLLALVVIPGTALAEPVVDEATVRAISKEFNKAIVNGDLSVFEKYMYPGSKITIDMDPAKDRGNMDISYDDFMQLTTMALEMMEGADVEDEVLSVSVDDASNQATVREKTTATVSMMGIKMRDVSIATTTYGVVNGQIKVLETQDELISSEAIQ